ncbi:hypothetical protein HDV00_000019 [Rhizophlyctis rosea]|nr:hypothetical protein HDV00_000019 [Rhizophlyctis rosea]
MHRSNSVSSMARSPSTPTILLNGLADTEPELPELPEEHFDDFDINLADTIKYHTKTTTLLNVTEETIYPASHLDEAQSYPSLCRSVKSVVIHSETITTVKRTASQLSRHRFSAESSTSASSTDDEPNTPATPSYPLPRRSQSFDETSTVRHFPAQYALNRLRQQESTTSISTNAASLMTLDTTDPQPKKRHPVVKAMRRLHKSASMVGLWAAARVGLNKDKEKKEGGVYGDQVEKKTTGSTVSFATPTITHTSSLSKSFHVKWQPDDASRRTSMVVKEKVAAHIGKGGEDVSASYRLVLAAVQNDSTAPVVPSSHHLRSDSNASQTTVLAPISETTDATPSTPPLYTSSQKEWASLLLTSSPPSPASEKFKNDYFDADNTGAHLVCREADGGQARTIPPPAGNGWKVVWRRLGVNGI